jgi:hypothetical protein
VDYHLFFYYLFQDAKNFHLPFFTSPQFIPTCRKGLGAYIQHFSWFISFLGFVGRIRALSNLLHAVIFQPFLLLSRRLQLLLIDRPRLLTIRVTHRFRVESVPLTQYGQQFYVPDCDRLLPVRI